MTEQVVLRVARPYPSEDDYIVAEGWTIDDKSILLVDQPGLAKDTIIRFEVVLDDGSKPIRAEGKVSKLVPATGERPGGLKVRFRRFDAATKRFIEKVMVYRRQERRSKRPAPAAELAPLVLDPEPSTSAPEPSAPEPSSALDQSAPEASPPSSPNIDVDDPSSPEAAERIEVALKSGERPRVVAAPPNRDELLARLRERAKRAG